MDDDIISDGEVSVVGRDELSLCFVVIVWTMDRNQKEIQ